MTSGDKPCAATDGRAGHVCLRRLGSSALGRGALGRSDHGRCVAAGHAQRAQLQLSREHCLDGKSGARCAQEKYFCLLAFGGLRPPENTLRAGPPTVMMRGMAEDRHAAAMNDYYQRGEEADRLDTASAGQLEFERTQEIVRRRGAAARAPLPPSQAGGSGASAARGPSRCPAGRPGVRGGDLALGGPV